MAEHGHQAVTSCKVCMKSAPSLSVSSEQRGSLEKMARSTSLPHRGVVQAKALLWAADGVANEEIARRCGVDSDAVRRWRRRFSELGVAGVGVIAKGRGRRSWLPEGTVAEVVRVTLEETPDDTSTHWTTRSLAKRFGIGKDTVARIWQDHHLQPSLRPETTLPRVNKSSIHQGCLPGVS